MKNHRYGKKMQEGGVVEQNGRAERMSRTEDRREDKEDKSDPLLQKPLP